MSQIKDINAPIVDENGKTKRRFRMDLDFRLQSHRLRTILVVLLALLMLGEIGYQVYMAQARKTGVKTQTALVNTIYKTIDTEAFVLREESLVSYAGRGTVVPNVRNGSKVGVGDPVAKIYTSASAAEKSLEASYLQDELEYYTNVQRFSGSALAVANEIYKSNVLASLMDVETALNENALSVLPEKVRALSTNVTRQQIANGKVIDVDAQISTLTARIESLSAGLTGCTQITAESAGYYVSETDGFESVGDYASAASMTAADVETLLRAEPRPALNNVGKLITQFNWYVVCNVPEADADVLRVGRKLKVVFSDAGDKLLTLSVKAKNENENGVVTLVLAGDRMDDSISALRKEHIRIRVEEYTGFPVDSKAIRTKQEPVYDEQGKDTGKTEDVIGVYVRMERTAKFRKITIVYTGDGFVLAENTADTGYLHLYDEVIVEGTELYDGKVLD